MLINEVVENEKERSVGSVRTHNERRCGSSLVLARHVDGHMPRVRSGMTRCDNQLRGIVWIGRAKRPGIAGNAGIDLAVGRVHYEFDHFALRDAELQLHFRSWRMGGPKDEGPIGL